MKEQAKQPSNGLRSLRNSIFTVAPIRFGSQIEMKFIAKTGSSTNC